MTSLTGPAPTARPPLRALALPSTTHREQVSQRHEGGRMAEGGRGKRVHKIPTTIET